MNQQQTLENILSKTGFSIADFENIAAMKQVRSLAFPPESKFPRHAFQFVVGLEKLKFLHFDNSKLNFDDLRDIAGIESLTRLDLKNCPVKDKMLSPLTAMPNLRDLWLTNTKIGDKGLAHIARISNLEWLILEGTRVTDKGMAQLAANLNLKTLWINRTGVTDRGLLELAPLTRLTAINSNGSKVTDHGLDLLFAAQQEQLNKAKKPAAAADPREAEAARSTLIAFFIAMQEWEESCVLNSPPEDESGYMAPGAYEAFIARQAEDCREIFAAYCTDKKRAYGLPNVISYQSPSGYDINSHEITGIDQETRSRISIYTKEGDRRHKFVLLKKYGKWLMDHRKIWLDGWSEHSL